MSFEISRVHGIVVPVITPLNEDESIDESSLHKVINYLLEAGVHGISNLIPKHCVRLYNEIKAGSKNVFDLQREINEIWRVYECRSFLGGIKAAMSLLGLCKPITAKPILAASEEEIQKIRRILSERIGRSQAIGVTMLFDR